MLAKLSELLFLEAVRRSAQRRCRTVRRDGSPGCASLTLGRALALLHSDITRRWTVDDLGREVGLSRSALADRFIRLIGLPPMHSLTNWRMQVAIQKLRNTSASLAQVAETVGYDSEAAFSRAFKKAFGAAPATWRRSNRSRLSVRFPVSRAVPRLHGIRGTRIARSRNANASTPATNLKLVQKYPSNRRGELQKLHAQENSNPRSTLPARVRNTPSWNFESRGTRQTRRDSRNLRSATCQLKMTLRTKLTSARGDTILQ